MKKKYVFKSSVICLFLTAALFTACKKSTNEEPELSNEPSTCTSAKYVIMNTSGAWPSQTSYLQSLSELNIGSLGNSNALEIPASATIWKFDGSVYSSSFGAPATLVKYRLDENCKPVLTKKMIVVGANAFSSIEFISSTKAYASVGGGLAKLVIFNPTTMEITGEVDLAGIQKAGCPNVYYCGAISSGNHLFLATYYSDANYENAYDSCFVAVVDMQADKVIKMLSDGRTGMILGNGPLANVFAKDEKGDIYVQGLGYTFKGREVPSGILRIKKDEMNFDPAYFLNLRTETGKDCYSVNCYSGTAFTWRVEDPTDFYCFNGANFKLYKIDLVNAKSMGEVSASLPKTKATQSAPMRLLENNVVYFGVAGDAEDALWTYDLTNGAVKKKMILVGQCNGIEKLQ